MSFPAAAGYRDIGSTDMKYIPEINSLKWLAKFFKHTVFGEIANRDHEEEISDYGDTVNIRALPDITIRTYRKGMTLIYEQPVSTAVQLLIDQGAYWGFTRNKVDDKQTDMKDYATQWGDVAMKQTKEKIDLAVLGNVYSSASAYNKGGAAGLISANVNLGIDGGVSVALTKADVLDKFAECAQVLGEQEIPEDGRWAVIPEWIATLIFGSDLKGADFSGLSQSIMMNGKLPRQVAGFTLYKSNQLSTGADASANTCTRVLFGTKHAISFASQITINENLINPLDFGTLHRGLQVYGYKVVVPSALGVLFCRNGS